MSTRSMNDYRMPAQCRICAACALALLMSLGLVMSPAILFGAAWNPTHTQNAEDPNDTKNAPEGEVAGGICGPLNICSDPDCSTAARCAASCFGNPTCATQCGGSPCNVGCNPGVCGAGCPQRCNPTTCPQNICIAACGDPDCKVACGGNPCNSGCPDRCDAGLCPANALCVASCGGSPCNAGCNPGVCGAGCPQECNAGLCPSNALCLASCGGDPCNIGCTPCGSGCALECDPVLCPANLENCVLNLLNSVSSRVDTTINRATEARDRATEARNNAEDMVDNMQDGLQNLTTEMRDWIVDAVAELQQAILAELAGAEAFINGPNSCSLECEAFRTDLLTLLTSIEEMSNAFLATSDINGQLDFSAEADFVEALSGKALYPLYRAMQALPVMDDEFLATMSQIAQDLETVAPIIAEEAFARGVVPDVCLLLAENDELAGNVITAAQNINKVGKGTKLAGGKLNALGKRKINGRAGVWGWAGVSYTGGLLERIGTHLESLGNRLSPIADKVEDKLKYCVLKTNQENIIGSVGTNHEQFLQSDQEILDVLLSIPLGNGGDLNGDGAVDLADHALLINSFGSQ